MANKQLLTGLALGVLGGFVVGYIVGTLQTASSPKVAAAQAAPAAPPAGMPGMPGDPHDHGQQHQRILANEQAVLQNPQDLQAWIALGNDYFDTHQAAKSVLAYGKALELDPNNPDVLTDQGVMYREMGENAKALANFEKAQKLNPKHLQSLYNVAIVMADDMRTHDKAIKAFNKVIELAPGSPQAAQARQALTGLQASK